MKKNRKNIKISSLAPSKIILNGEHAVVNSYSALSIAVEYTINVELFLKEETNGNFLTINTSNNINKHLNSMIEIKTDIVKNVLKKFEGISSDKIDENVILSLKSQLSAFNVIFENEFQRSSIIILLVQILLFDLIELLPFNYKINSFIPINGGMGSSAAYSASLAAANYVLKEVIESKREIEIKKNFKFSVDDKNIINKIAYCTEKILHGNASGIDNSTSVFGSLIYFKNLKIERNLNKNAFCKNFNKTFGILLIDSCVERSTLKLVSKVQKQSNNNKQLNEEIFKELSNISDNIFDIISVFNDDKDVEFSKENIKLILKLISKSQILLEKLEISNNEINDIVSISKKYDFVMKITGAGGGGTVFCLYDKKSKDKKDLEKLKMALKEKGYKVYETKLRKNGVEVSVIR